MSVHHQGEAPESQGYSKSVPLEPEGHRSYPNQTECGGGCCELVEVIFDVGNKNCDI